MIVSSPISLGKDQVWCFAVMFKDFILYFLNPCFVVGEEEVSSLLSKVINRAPFTLDWAYGVPLMMCLDACLTPDRLLGS